MKKQRVRYFFPEKKYSIIDKHGLKQAVAQLIRKEGKKLESVNYIFCSDEYLLSINQKYLNHNYYTDIITFDLSNDPKIVVADIYVSFDRVKENAEGQKVSIRNELARVLFHGALHLCGYNDTKPVDIRKMRKKEEFYLNLYFGNDDI